jgi:phosphatidylserine/phosphatidylglycerophosphate/cardiolipin synthase-like enzyme
VGSINLAPGSFDERRELAIEVDDHKIVRRLGHVIEHDWKHSRPIDLSDEALRRDLKKYGPEVIHSLAISTGSSSKDSKSKKEAREKRKKPRAGGAKRAGKKRK